MKKILASILFILSASFVCACTANDSSTDSSSGSSGSSSPPPIVCEHDLFQVSARPATCQQEGIIEYYRCRTCAQYFADAAAETVITYEQTRLPKTGHTGVKIEEAAASCGKNGVQEHWKCETCNGLFTNAECTVSATTLQLQTPTLPHENLTHNEQVAINAYENGIKEHWFCEDCEQYFLEEAATSAVEYQDVILYSPFNMVDFIVEIPEDKDLVVLQLSDTQIIDGAQSRPTQSSGDKTTYATEKIKEYCYDYVEETITATNPDLIIITGDLLYGKYDDNGSALQAFIAFMEKFETPWAPVFGNHDQESAMGADWQCEQLENAQYCMFLQRELTGNGNYTVGVKQGDKLSRIFVMLDSNGCSDASAQSIANGHTATWVGFGKDQIDWYTQQITRLKESSPATKISFAFHIQLSAFGDALKKYGFNQNNTTQNIFVEERLNYTEGDFGYIGRKMKNGWDSSNAIYEGIKALGADSIYVGHEHCNSASVVYEGIRFQYGQKSSEYDRFNCVSSTGEISTYYLYNKQGTPLIGGTVNVFSATDGSFINGYIYYCKNAGALLGKSAS